MKAVATAKFDHSGKPFGSFIGTVEFIPDTPEEHSALKKLAHLNWVGERVFMSFEVLNASNEQITAQGDGDSRALPEPVVQPESRPAQNEPFSAT